MASLSSASSSSKLCFNSGCEELKPPRPKKGWRLRNGDFAELCDRCGSAFEEGRFCETFHSNASGWRSCESCRKGIHCGCIVSSTAFVLLDPGGIECITCTRKNYILPTNPAWPQSLFFYPPEKVKDPSVKIGVSQLTGSGSVPWKQAPSLFSSSISASELHSRIPYEVNVSNGFNKFNGIGRMPTSSVEKKIEDLSERSINGNLKFGAREIMLVNGIKCEEKSASSLNVSQCPSSLIDNLSIPMFGLKIPYESANGTRNQVLMTGTHPQQNPVPQGKQFNGNMLNGIDSSAETHVHTGQSGGDAQGRHRFLSRYRLQCSEQELQQITVDSNSVVTPLFQKTLSASDAGRIGRLVLPKKCAEAYFPQISHPEGLPLKILDAKGKEWIFQFRFWPNNNSRMYVLEGVTPCIQSMQLQAGDTVTFSRLEPEGKLVMGFRKSSNATTSDMISQDNETNKLANGVKVNSDVELTDPNSWLKVDKSGNIAKEVLGNKAAISRKRKSSTLGSKSKRLRIEKEDLIQLKLTWEEAQGLLRPPPDHVPSVVVIEGFEFEEYEDAPVLGKPTILSANNVGEKIQWAQCEDCLKWRKLPTSALLPSKWKCSNNNWDPERSSCSAPQELTLEELEDMISPVASKKMKSAKDDNDKAEVLEGLDTLADMAILGEGESLAAASQTTTKHPRHRPGCSCIVCIQPPSGRKHKQLCTCYVCLTVRRRFRTQMMRREKRQSERQEETSPRKLHQQQKSTQSQEILLDQESLPCSDTENNSQNQNREVNNGSNDDPSKVKSSATPFIGQIDLNTQPEREEELSPNSDSGSMLQDAAERYLRQQSLSASGVAENSSGSQTQPGGGDGPGKERLASSIASD